MNKLTLKKVITLAIFAALLAIPAGNVFANGQSDTATVETSATIMSPLTIEGVQGLNFGQIFTPSSAVTAVVSHTGATSGAEWFSTADVTPAQFTVNGEPGMAVNVTLPTASYQVSNGADSMTVSNFTSNVVGNTVTLDGIGDATINIGASLSIAAGQRSGLYEDSASLSVTVSY